MRIAFAFLLLIASTAAAAPKFWGGLQTGSHAVGFRTFTGESAPGSAGWKERPMEIAVWYPARMDSKSAPLTFGDYLAASPDLLRRSASLPVMITGKADGLPEELVKEILSTPMFARQNAQPAGGPYPLVMWSPRYGTVAAQSVLSEYLASHGYVVAAARPKESQEKLPFELKSDEEKLEELDAQTDDLRGALGAVRALPEADDARTAVVAWSYAGESAWRIAQSDARIDLVAALDTNVDRGWVYQKKVNPVPVRFPLLRLDRSSEGFEKLAHGNFNALEGMIPAILGIESVQPWSSSGPTAKQGYETVAMRLRTALADTFARERPVPFTTIEFAARDDSPVTADLYRAPSAGRCVALFHQSGSSRGEYRTIAPELVALGYTALSVDVRWGNRDRWNDVLNETAARHRAPEAMASGDRSKMAPLRAAGLADLEAAVEWLRSNGCEKPIVWGSSIHANAVFELASKHSDAIGGVIDISPGEYDPNDPDRMKKMVSGVRTPSLVMWGRTESDLSKPIFDALPEGRKWSYASTGRHGNALVFEDVEAWTRIRQFLTAVAKLSD